MKTNKPTNPQNEILRTVLTVAIHRRRNNPIYGDYVITVSLEDDAAGAFIKLGGGDNDGVLRIDLDELETVLAVAKEMITNYKTNKYEPR
jgi:hypothetical protein